MKKFKTCEATIITQKRLCDLAGIHPSNHSRFKSGKELPTLRVAFKLSQVLGKDVFSYTLEEFGIQATFKILSEAVPKASDGAKQVLQQHLESLIRDLGNIVAEAPRPQGVLLTDEQRRKQDGGVLDGREERPTPRPIGSGPGADKNTPDYGGVKRPQSKSQNNDGVPPMPAILLKKESN